jgi:Tol biopolymer transport system component
MHKTLLTGPGVLALGVLAFPAAPQDTAKPPKPINLTINTKANEDDPHLSSNGLTLYYTSNAKAGKLDIMFSRRRSLNHSWSPGEILQDYIQTETDDRSVFTTTDGRFPQFLYYATKKAKGNRNYDLYVAVKHGSDKAFAAPTPLNTIDTPADELHPWLTADGRKLYFSRKTLEGWRVFVASRSQATGPTGFGEPTLLSDLPPGFHHVTLTPDGRTMYLQGPLEEDRWGLFTATFDGKNWSKPEPLNQLNNADGPTGDRSPCLSRDGSRLYFASDRPGGKGGLDIWVVATADLKMKK